MNQIFKVSAKKGFTLIELLIVVAIIAILAAIAVPNFLEAQVRAKVSRARNDLRAIATALEAYRIDSNRYPYEEVFNGYSFPFVPYRLTSPISYVTEGVLYDVFRVEGKSFSTNPANVPLPLGATKKYNFRYNYYNAFQWLEDARYQGSWVDGETGNAWIPRPYAYQGHWALHSFGPDLKYGPSFNTRSAPSLIMLYDPTNGTVSPGDLARTQRHSEGKGLDGAI